MKSVRLHILGRALIAAVAISAAASPAKADLLSLSGGGSTTGYSATVSNGSTGTVTLGDLTVKYTVSDTLVNGTETLSVAITAKQNSTASAGSSGAGLSFTLDGSTAGYSVGSGAGTLTSTTGISSQSKASGASVGSQAIYSDFSNGTLPGLPSGNVKVLSNSFVSGSSSNTETITGTNPFNLSTTGTLTNLATKGSTVSFTSTAQVHGVPEPSGVIAALAGMPCAGLLLGFARRLRRPVV